MFFKKKYIQFYVLILQLLNVISSQKSIKTQKNLLFFHFIPCSAHPYCTKVLLICVENGFSHSIASMFHSSRGRDIRTSPFWSYKDPNFEKSSETPQFSYFFAFAIFQMKYFFCRLGKEWQAIACKCLSTHLKSFQGHCYCCYVLSLAPWK